MDDMIATSQKTIAGTAEEDVLVTNVQPSGSSAPEFGSSYFPNSVYDFIFFPFIICMIVTLFYSDFIFLHPQEASSPSSLASLVSSILSFPHPFTTTSFVNKLDLGKMTNEEGTYKARTHILDGLHWMNEVSLCSKARTVVVAI